MTNSTESLCRAAANHWWRFKVLCRLLKEGVVGGVQYGLDEWRTNIKGQDPDSLACCVPSFHNPCGRGGATLRESYGD